MTLAVGFVRSTISSGFDFMLVVSIGDESRVDDVIAAGGAAAVAAPAVAAIIWST